jgi:GDPmannose 4,6-dehydratase
MDNQTENKTESKIACVTGITGQDGSYLTDFLLEMNYFVYGMVRRASNFNTQRIDHLRSNPKLRTCFGNLEDESSIQRMFSQIELDHPGFSCLEIYHLGAQSHVKVSFEIPIETMQVTGVGTLKLLECIRVSGLIPRVKFYNATSSELFGKIQKPRQDEDTPFYPRSPYAVAKQMSFWMTKQYREAYGLFGCNGMLFNHESPRRGRTFVTRKVTEFIGTTITSINTHTFKRGSQCRDPNQVLETLKIGNLEARRDWSDARDMVRGMWLMLQQEKPDDYVLSSDVNHSVREFIEIAFQKRDMQIVWKGEGYEEKGYIAETGQLIIEVSEQYFRPTEVDVLLGCSDKARRILNWFPVIGFHQMIYDMLQEDCPHFLEEPELE